MGPDRRISLSLPSLFGRFLKFGLLAWGGPVAQIAMIRRVAVDEQQWLSPDRFNRLLSVYQILPGPEAHELCVHLGMAQRGRVGGLLAGLGFMLPGFLLMLVLAWSYQRLDFNRPGTEAVFWGVQVGVIALIAHGTHRVGRHILVDSWLWTIAIASAIATLFGVGFWIVLPAAGLSYWLAAKGKTVALAATVAVAIGVAATSHLSGGPPWPSVEQGQGSGVGVALLFLAGLKAGLLTFGGAYAAIPFVRDDSVGRGWVSDGQFLDGLAVTGLIPAPLIMFVTFVGYLAGGLAGALAITAGVFLPAFALTLLLFDRLERVMDNRRLHYLLDGVAAAVVGMIAATFIILTRTVANDVPSILAALAMFVGALAILYSWRNGKAVVAVIACSAVAGAIAF